MYFRLLKPSILLSLLLLLLFINYLCIRKNIIQNILLLNEFWSKVTLSILNTLSSHVTIYIFVFRTAVSSQHIVICYYMKKKKDADVFPTSEREG